MLRRSTRSESSRPTDLVRGSKRWALHKQLVQCEPSKKVFYIPSATSARSRESLRVAQVDPQAPFCLFRLAVGCCGPTRLRYSLGETPRYLAKSAWKPVAEAQPMPIAISWSVALEFFS